MAFDRKINGFYDNERALPEYIFRTASRYFEKEEKDKLDIKTQAEFENRRKMIKSHFKKVIGSFDNMQKCELNPVVTKEIVMPEYMINCVRFSSMENFTITGSLYLPRVITGKIPAILVTCGHAEEGKAYPPYQKVGAELAANGFAAFVMDPISQGERKQYPYKDPILGCTREHDYMGLSYTLMGANIARHEIFDMIRGIDYLCSLELVDNQKIGITGNSGGGTQSSYALAFDDRIKAAFPCTYITSRQDYMYTGQAHDAEQNLFGAIKVGLNYDDLITVFAPKPVAIGAVEYDFFNIEGTLKSYDRAKRVYNLFGKSENVEYIADKSGHEYTDKLRLFAVQFFTKHLYGKLINPSPIDIEILPQETLYATKEGNCIKSDPNERSVHYFIQKYKENHKPDSIINIIDLKERVINILNMPGVDNDIIPRFFDASNKDGVVYTDGFFFSQKFMPVPFTMIYKKDSNHHKCTVLLFNDGTKDIDKNKTLIEVLLSDSDICIVNARGLGDNASYPLGNSSKDNPFVVYGTEHVLNNDALMLGTSLTSMRVFDVLRTIDMLADEYGYDKYTVFGEGYASVYAQYVSFLSDRVNELMMKNPILSYYEFVEPTDYFQEERINIFGVLSQFDLPDLRTKKVTII